MKPVVVAVFLLFVTHPLVAGEIYRCTNEKGNQIFTDRPCNGKVKTITESSVVLSQEALQGRWLIIESGGRKSEEMGVGDDIWQFSGNRWTASSSGITMQPEQFKVVKDQIDFGNYQITVKEITENTLTVETMGIVQKLEKM